eukprot:gene17695-19463_t
MTATEPLLRTSFPAPKLHTPCKNILKALPQGEWKQRENVTYKDIVAYSKVVMKMRLQKGWPPLLYHGDMRCGAKYPLPRLVHTNNTQRYHLDIPSQCDLQSEAPCCRDDIGWCGKGDEYCRCPMCTDYRTFVPAELATWKTSNGCDIPKITTKEACNELSSRFSSATFLGDSLVRHLFTALMILLTDNVKSGGLRTDLNAKYTELCGGESQFVDSACHNKLAITWNDVASHVDYCSHLKQNQRPVISFEQTHSVKQAELAIQRIKQRLREPQPLIVLGIGVHDSFNHTKIIDEFLSPIVQLKKVMRNNNAEFVWLSTHSAGPLKPTEFRESQGNAKIKLFNAAMKEFCSRNDIHIMDTFNLTTGIHSFDGTHYGFEINRLKVQLLLNGLREQ